MSDTRLFHTALLVGGLLGLQSVALAADEDGLVTSFAFGTEYSTGKYGADSSIDETYLPLTAIFSGRRTSLRLMVPYLSVRAPEGTTYDADGVPVPGSGRTVTNSGLGDVVLGLTVYDVIRSSRHGFTMDITGKAKFGTADETLGLGTGENDYSLQADFYKFANRTMLMASLGYRLRGDPAGIDLDNTFIAAIGASYRYSADLAGGLFYNFREASLDYGDSGQELTAFLSRRIADNWRVQAYVLAGFGDNSPDWGGGFQLRKTLNRRD